MNTRHILVIATIVGLSSVPLATADWMGRGFYEPDTFRDQQAGMMFTDPDTNPSAAVKKVYFSAFGAYYVLTPNHNSATLGTQVLPYPTNMHAILGIWKDCNKDGYIGLPEGLFAEYPAQLLTDTSVCAPTPTVDHADPSFTPVHNDGEWVREFLAIGPDYVAGVWGTEDDQGREPQNNTNHYNIPDEKARIWGDWGLPEDDTKASCPVNPRPTGTYQSTGGFLRYADCFTNWRATGLVNEIADLTGVQDLSFDDAPYYRPDQSGSVLNQQNPWGQESDASYATAFDCSEPVTYQDSQGVTRQRVSDPRGGDLAFVNVTDENGERFLVASPSSPGTNPSGSAAGTVNETGEAVGQWGPQVRVMGVLNLNGGDEGGSDGEGTCSRDDDDGGVTSGQIYEADEAPFEGTTPIRVQTDVWYFFTEGGYNGLLVRDDSDACVEDPTVGEHCSEVPWRGWPGDLGQSVFQANTPYSTSGTWFGTPGYAVSRNPYINRDNLQPWGGVYYTAYAYVDAATLGVQLAGGGAVGVYGSGHCDNGRVITGFFNCDPDAWWKDADGDSLAVDWNVVVGQAYNLMDIDCYDASSRHASAVNTGLVGMRTCERPV